MIACFGQNKESLMLYQKQGMLLPENPKGLEQGYFPILETALAGDGRKCIAMAGY